MKSYSVSVNGKKMAVIIEETTLSAQPVTLPIAANVSQPVSKPVETAAPAAPKATVSSGDGKPVNAPMPGTVLKLKASSGSVIKKGSPIIILEAMKMENEIVAPFDGVVTLCVAEGDKINSGDTIATVK